MRRPLISSFSFAFAFFGSLNAEAADPAAYAAPDKALAADELALVDRLAADFFEGSLRYAQSSRIEAQTATLYRLLSPGEKADFRGYRRLIWRALSEPEKRAFRGGVKRPLYAHLTEEQKSPFRRIAYQQLIGPAAPAEAIRTGETEI